jgi:hypothetical protein
VLTTQSAKRFLTLFDQSLSNFTNFVAVIIMARSLSAIDFGVVSTLIAGGMMAIGIGRGLIGEPALTRITAHNTEDVAPLSAALTIGVIASALCLVLAALLGPTYATGLLVLALIAPILVTQDSFRFVAIAKGRPLIACVSDMTWLVAMIALFAVTNIDARLTVADSVGIFGLSCLAGLIVIVVWDGQARRWAPPRRWFMHTRDLGGYYVADYIARNATPNVILVAVAGIAGLAQAGGLKAASSLFGPIRVLLWSAVLSFVPALRVRVLARENILRQVRLISLALTALAVLIGLALFAIPTHYGRLLFGATWPAAHPLVIPLTVFTAAMAWNGGTAVGFRANEAARESTKVRVVQEIALIVLGIGGAFIDGAKGGAWGLSLGAILSCLLWEFQLSRTIKTAPEPDGTVIPPSLPPLT